MALLTAQKQQASAMGAFAKAGDLQKRIIFTIIALIVFRFGTHIPLPGIDPNKVMDIFSNSSAKSLLGMLNTFVGGALSRMSILTLGITPYISASILIQVGSYAFESLVALRKEGESGHRKLNQYTRYLTILMTILQAYAVAIGLEKEGSVVMSSIWTFRLTTVISLLCGTLFIVWLGNQITSRGVGNGISLVIAIGILSEVPSAFARVLELGRAGELSQMTVFVLLVMTIVFFVVVVMVERAQRRIVIQYPKGMSVGVRSLSMKNSYFPLKINIGGIMPPFVSAILLMMPLLLLQYLANSGGSSSGVAQTILVWFRRGDVLYVLVHATLIMLLAFFFTALYFNTNEVAEDLKKNGGFIAGIRPGKSTAEYLDYVATRLTFFGGIYLIALCVIPEILIFNYSIPFILSGVSLLIVVTVIMDTMSQIQSRLFASQYESLIRKAQLKGRL